MIKSPYLVPCNSDFVRPGPQSVIVFCQFSMASLKDQEWKKTGKLFFCEKERVKVAVFLGTGHSFSGNNVNVDFFKSGF